MQEEKVEWFPPTDLHAAYRLKVEASDASPELEAGEGDKGTLIRVDSRLGYLVQTDHYEWYKHARVSSSEIEKVEELRSIVDFILEFEIEDMFEQLKSEPVYEELGIITQDEIKSFEVRHPATDEDSDRAFDEMCRNKRNGHIYALAFRAHERMNELNKEWHDGIKKD